MFAKDLGFSPTDILKMHQGLKRFVSDKINVAGGNRISQRGMIMTGNIEKKKAGGFERIGDILENTLKQWSREAGGPITRLWAVWDEAVGEAVAQNAQPSCLKNRVLTVHVTCSTWTQHLQFLKSDMIVALNRAAGGPLVDDIRFKIGDLES